MICDILSSTYKSLECQYNILVHIYVTLLFLICIPLRHLTTIYPNVKMYNDRKQLKGCCLYDRIHNKTANMSKRQ